MNIGSLFDMARAANREADVTIRDGKKFISVEWHWPGKQLQSEHQRICIPMSSLDPDRYPFFAVRGYLQMAAEAMIEKGGVPDRAHELFRKTSDVQSYAQQRDLLEMKFNTGIMSSQQYVDGMMQLITKRDRDNGWWPNGANQR